MFTEYKDGEVIQEKLKPSLKNLSYLLKHKELWPKDFSWFYPNPNNCALGLSRKYWGREISDRILPNRGSQIYEEIFLTGMFTKKFLFFSWKTPGNLANHSPQQVAREIDLFLRR